MIKRFVNLLKQKSIGNIHNFEPTPPTLSSFLVIGLLASSLLGIVDLNKGISQFKNK